MVSSDAYTKVNSQITHKTSNKLLDEISICGFAIYNIFGTLINSYYARIDWFRLVIDFIRIAIVFVLVLDILDNLLRKKVKLLNAFYVFAVLSVLIFVVSKRYNLIFMMIFATWAGCLDYKYILKIGIKFKIIGICIVVISALSGIIQNDTVTRLGSQTLRYSLGFIAPSLCLAYILNIIVAEIVISDFDVKWSKIFSYSLLVLLVYFITDARLDAFICLFMLMAAIIAKIFKCKTIKFFKIKFLVLLSVLTPIIAFLLNVLLLYGFKLDISLFVNIASHLSRRIEYTLEAFDLVGFNLFGSSVVWQNYDIILDSSYFKLLLEYGIVGLLLILYGYCAVIKKTVNNKNFAVLFAIVLVLGESIFEPFLFDYNYNYLILLFGSIFIKNSKQQGGAYEYKKCCGGSCNA